MREGENIIEFGLKVRVARLRAGLTQAELAERVGVDRGTIGRLETGRTREPHGDLIRRIAEVLGVKAEAFVQQGDDGFFEGTWVSLPILTTQDLRVLEGCYVSERTTKRSLRLPAEYIGALEPAHPFCFQVQDGSLAIVNPNETPRSGDLLLVQIEDLFLFKRALRQADGLVLLDDDGKNQPVAFTPQTMKIIGIIPGIYKLTERKV